MSKNFLIYMPTYGRPEICLQQAKIVYTQILEFRKLQSELEINLLISINGDLTYDVEQLQKFSDFLINQPLNYGGNINIAFGFFQAKQNSYDFLWIIGDDEPITDTAIKTIGDLICNKEFDLLIGSKNTYGNFKDINSYMDLSNMTGGTPSFISSTVYSCKFSKEEAVNALEFEFTSFPHLVLINNFIERKNKIIVELVPLDSICKLNERFYTFPKVNRGNMGIRDSKVFFGKPLSLIGSRSKIYQKKEIYKWWFKNWHRFSMYYTNEDFRGDMLLAMTRRYKPLVPLISISKLPIWRLKNIFELVTKQSNV